MISDEQIALQITSENQISAINAKLTEISDINSVFEPNDIDLRRSKKFQYTSNSLLILFKHHVLEEKLIGNVLQILSKTFELKIINVAFVKLTLDEASKLLSVYRETIPNISNSIAYICSNNNLALQVEIKLKGEQDVEISQIFDQFQLVVGPYCPKTAKEIASDTVRGLFGQSIIKNVIHVTEFEEDREYE
ncbi:MAG: hypothetical protein MHPSP_000837, partial [Paramarteilia canceri]